MSFDSLKAQSYFKLPPDGAGKEIVSTEYWQVSYTGLTGTVSRGDYLTGQTSNAVGEVLSVDSTGPSTGYVSLIPEDEGSGSVLVASEILLKDGSPIATVSSVTKKYVQDFIQVGKNNPRWAQSIDKDGAAYVRFTEGPQQLDAYGNSRVTGVPHVVAAYTFVHDRESEDWTAVSASGGTVTHNAAQHAIVLAVDDVSGSKASYTSVNRWMSMPGAGQLVQLVVGVGDSGKNGCSIRWGYFDANDGFYFELSGTTLYTVHRHSTHGYMEEHKVAQASWNVDTVTSGTSESDFVLDVTKLNAYWLNLQTLSAGRVRYGVFNESGERLVVENLGELNVSALPTVRTTSLPLKVEIENLNATSGPSQIKLFGATVRSEGSANSDEITLSRFSSFVLPSATMITSSGQVPVASFRSAATYNGEQNRFITIPHGYVLHVSGSGVIFRILKNATLNTSSFSSAGSYTGVEADMMATSISGGREIYMSMYDVGVHRDHFSEHIWGTRGECMALLPDGGYGDLYTVTAERLEAVTASVRFGAGWADIG